MSAIDETIASMPERWRSGLWVYGTGVALLGVVIAAGVVEAFRFDRRMPAIDLFGNGSRAYIDHLLAAGDIDGAIEQLTMRTRMEPFDANHREQLGILLRSQQRPEEARQQFEALVKLRPDYAEWHHLLGSTYLDSNQPELALEYLQKAVLLDRQSATAVHSLGVAWAQLGDMLTAEQCFAKAVEISPDYVDAQINLARAREELQLAP